jgi:hypothetical protein
MPNSQNQWGQYGQGKPAPDAELSAVEFVYSAEEVQALLDAQPAFVYSSWPSEMATDMGDLPSTPGDRQELPRCRLCGEPLQRLTIHTCGPYRLVGGEPVAE